MRKYKCKGKGKGGDMDRKEYVNLGVTPETRALVNLYKARLELKTGRSVTTDEVVLMLLDAIKEQKPVHATERLQEQALL